MAYATYTTLALVCGTYNRHTADRSIQLFTREAGMLFADAKSVREERSRQRYALQDFSLVRVSLVKGKRSWKIGSVESLTNHYTAACDKEARGSIVSTYRLLRRFIRGEEAHPELFDFICSAFTYLSTHITNRQFVHDIVHVRILAELGYVDQDSLPGLRAARDVDGLLEVAPLDSYTTVTKLLSQAVATSQL